MNQFIKIILACLFLICLLDMPYGYYQLVRFIGMIVFGVLAYAAYTRKDNFYLVVWAASAILINPIVKIPIGREIWNVVDVIWAIGLMVSTITEKTNNTKDQA